MARNSLLCADVPLRNYSLTHSRLCRRQTRYRPTPDQIYSASRIHSHASRFAPTVRPSVSVPIVPILRTDH